MKKRPYVTTNSNHKQDTALLSRFKSKTMHEKLTLYEYLEELIAKMHREKERIKPKPLLNYTSLADDLPLPRKDKVKMIELLEEFFPPEKKIFESVKRRRNHGPLQNYLNLKKLQKLQKSKEEEDYQIGERFLDRICLNHNEIAPIRKDYRKKGGLRRYEKEKEIMNLLDDPIEDYKPGDFGDVFGEEIATIVSCSTELVGDIHFKFILNSRYFSMKNIIVPRNLLFHCITTFQDYKTIKILEFENINIGKDLLTVLFEYITAFCESLEEIRFVNVAIYDDHFDGIQAMVTKMKKLRKLEFTECGIEDKVFGGICLGILQGRSVKELILPRNSIREFLLAFFIFLCCFLFLTLGLDGYGTRYLMNLIKYYLPLQEFDVSENEFDKIELQQLRKVTVLSKRFKSNQYKF